MCDPHTIVVRLSEGDRLDHMMRRLRIWLDAEKIQPGGFKTQVGGKGYTFTIGFLAIGDADRFRAQFGAKPS
jgi:hypothetical protein